MKKNPRRPTIDSLPGLERLTEGLRCLVEQLNVCESSPVGGWYEVLGGIRLGDMEYRLLRRPSGTVRQALSPRERQVLRLVCRGRSSDDIAITLAISTWTVSTHIRRILNKMGASSRAEAAAIAMQEGLIGIEAPQANIGSADPMNQHETS